MNQPLPQPTAPHRHSSPAGEPDWLHAFQSLWPVADLHALPAITVSDCYIVSTGHGTSGPFTFGGVRLLDFIAHLGIPAWQQVDVISADGFGTRLTRAELRQDPPHHPSLLVYQRNGQSLRREEGLVRLIVPTEKDDALKQVKWVAEIVVYG